MRWIVRSGQCVRETRQSFFSVQKICFILWKLHIEFNCVPYYSHSTLGLRQAIVTIICQRWTVIGWKKHFKKQSLLRICVFSLTLYSLWNESEYCHIVWTIWYMCQTLIVALHWMGCSISHPQQVKSYEQKTKRQTKQKWHSEGEIVIDKPYICLILKLLELHCV